MFRRGESLNNPTLLIASWFTCLSVPPAITSTIHLLAISMGVFRLRHRYRTKQYYWDDLWAACTLIADVGLFLSIWLWPMYPSMYPAQISGIH